MSDTQIIFKKHLDLFANKTLSSFGYKPDSEKFPDYEPRTNILSYTFDNLSLNLSIDMFASEAPDGRKWIVFSMSQINGDRFHSGTFSLTDYLRAKGNQDFQLICAEGQDFDGFASKYFARLKEAFETYLHDQVTGVSFIAHNPLGK